MKQYTYLIMLAVYGLLLFLVAMYLNRRDRRRRAAGASHETASGGTARPGED